MFAACGSLSVVRCLLLVVWLFVVGCLFLVVCCLLLIVCCVYVVRFAVCCSFVV